MEKLPRTNNLLLSVALFAGLLLVACDPGITIRQSSVQAPSEHLDINVEPSNTLIGSAWYLSKFKVANTYHDTVTITEVQLVGSDKTYANDVQDPNMYPAKIPPQGRQDLAAAFHLQNDLGSFFAQPVQLRVTYEVAEKKEVAAVTLTGR